MPMLLAIKALDLLPPRIKQSILQDDTFTTRWDIHTETNVTLGKTGLSFNHDQLCTSVRNAIHNPLTPIEVKDLESTTWHLLAQPQEETLSFLINSGERQYRLLDHYSALADDRKVRIAWFELNAEKNGFNGSAYQTWRDLLYNRAPNNQEFINLTADCEQTPIAFYRNLQTSIKEGEVNLATLVPNGLKYYQRLVGPVGLATTVADYIETGAKP